MTGFGKKLRDDDTLSGLTEKLEKGTAVYADAQEYAYRVGAALSETFREELSSDVLPDGRMYFNIANRVVRDPLTRAYKLIADECEAVQAGLNRAAGIGLTPQRPAFPENRIKGFVDRISSEPNYDDVSWILGEPVRTYSQSIVDDSVRANAEQHYKAGLSPRIIRTSAAHCCEWCNDVAGTYDYPAVPKDVYRRHNFCRCQVEYDPRTGRRQDVHTRRWSDEKNYKQSGKSLTRSGVDEVAAGKLPKKLSRYIPDEKLRKDIIRRGIQEERAIFAEGLLGEVAKGLPPEEGKYDVVMHGYPYCVEFFGQKIDADTLCAIIAQRKDYEKGTDIRLISCYTGSQEDGVAQYIANKLNVTVWAPDKKGFILKRLSGTYEVYAGSEKGKRDGRFIPFYPKPKNK